MNITNCRDAESFCGCASSGIRFVNEQSIEEHEGYYRNLSEGCTHKVS